MPSTTWTTMASCSCCYTPLSSSLLCSYLHNLSAICEAAATFAGSSGILGRPEAADASIFFTIILLIAESFTSLYGYSMSVAAPGFGLAVIGLGPSTVHWWGYLLLWSACSGLVAWLVYTKLSKTGMSYASK